MHWLFSLAPRWVTLGLMLALSCATTKTTWRAGNLTHPLRNVVVWSQTADEMTRRSIEDAFARELSRHGVAGVPAYTMFPQGQPSTLQIQQALQGMRADGIIVVRPIGVAALPASGIAVADGLPGSKVGSSSVATLLNIEARAFSTQGGAPATGELIWTGRGQGQKPSSLIAVASRAVPGFVADMAKTGIVPPVQPTVSVVSVLQQPYQYETRALGGLGLPAAPWVQ
jgi:hypothetical protein